MSRQLFWKLCIIFATGVVGLFYFIDQLTSQTEEGMSLLAVEHRQTITQWGRHAEALYNSGDTKALNNWLDELKVQEDTWVSVIGFNVNHIAGDATKSSYYEGYNLGRNVDWKIHLYFEQNPVMEVPFSNQPISFLIQLPNRMRPGAYWQHTRLIMQIFIPTILLALMSYFLYRYIMKPLLQLQTATRYFSSGNFDIRASKLMGNRNDEFSDLASTFDQMATRIGEQITSQRQLIADLSHELRTPLTRLDIALSGVKEAHKSENIERIARESTHIRRLVEDTLTLAWLENEQPQLQQEPIDLTDLLEVIIEDARFEFPDRQIICQLPKHAEINNSSHRAAGQAIENILRNALRYTPAGKAVTVTLEDEAANYTIGISDQGPGVPEPLLKAIFKPFFRVDKSRENSSNSFGLGLALAERQLAAIRANVSATNNQLGGLAVTITLPKQ